MEISKWVRHASELEETQEKHALEAARVQACDHSHGSEFTHPESRLSCAIPSVTTTPPLDPLLPHVASVPLSVISWRVGFYCRRSRLLRWSESRISIERSLESRRCVITSLVTTHFRCGDVELWILLV